MGFSAESKKIVISAQTSPSRFVFYSLFLILSFWALNQAAYFFEFAPGISLFYPPSALAMYLIYALGPRYLPVYAVAILLGGLPDREIWNYDLAMLIPDVRQFLIYGGAGLLLRKLHPNLHTLDAKFFYALMIAALLTATVSAFIIFMAWQFNHAPGQATALEPTISLFIGNLTGAITAIPIFVFFQFWRNMGTNAFRLIIAEHFLQPGKALAFLIVIGLTVLVIELGTVSEDFSNYYYFLLLPIIWSTVKWDLGTGLFFAFFGNLLALKLFILEGVSNFGVIEVQMMFVASIVSAVLIGLVHDQKDRFFQWSMHDDLTRLPNMRLFQETGASAIARAKRNGQPLAVLFVDIDGFKGVNDTYGHKMGDYVLQQLSVRIKNCARESDCVARFGGDEFVVMLERSSAPGANKVAQSMVQAVSVPFPARNGEVSMGASIGIAIYPQDGADMETLIRNADRAMYLAKDNGKNSVRTFDVAKNEAS